MVNQTIGESTREEAEGQRKGLSRRSFLELGALGAAGFTALGLAGCSPTESRDLSDTGSEQPDQPAELPPADAEESCDVVVVGLGTSGLCAACAAASAGAKVIGFDRVSSMDGTNTSIVTGVWAVESEASKRFENHLTVREMFDYLWPATHYQTNALMLRNLLPATGKGVDLLTEGGVKFKYSFENADETTSILWRGGHDYVGYGPERAELLQGALDHYGVDSRWNCQATDLLMEDGVVVGVRYKSGSTVTDIKAKSVVIGCGGFIQNPDMQKELLAGAIMYGPGNQYDDGSGIRLAQSAGAQIGKNFNCPMNECGGCNPNSSARFVSLADCNDTPAFALPLFGGLMVNKRGKRFIDESKMAKEMMYCSEPLMREGVYYVIIDEGFVQDLASTPIMELIDPEAWAKMGDIVKVSFMDKTLTNLPSMLDQGIEEGWIWKADTAEQLAEACGLASLPDTVKRYNEYCGSGDDDELYKEASFLRPVDSGALYAVELYLAAWTSMGGIKTDERCQALDENADTVPNLFICGTDGDFWGVPYFQGGSAQGFCVGTGYMAGTAAAEDALGK